MKSNKNIIKKFKILVLKSYWRAALNPLAGRVFEVPALRYNNSRVKGKTFLKTK